MSFTDQKPRIVTQEDIDSPWGGFKDGRNFRCGFCGYKFKVGDTWRWIYTNGQSDMKGIAGNPFVCIACDAPIDVLLMKLQKTYEEFMQDKFWRLRSR